MQVPSACCTLSDFLWLLAQAASHINGDQRTVAVPFIPSMTLPLDRRRRIGTKCKQLIDAGRLHFLRSSGFASARSTSYVGKGVTGENCMLLGTNDL